MKIANYINHVLFVLDRSGSMTHLSDAVVKVFDAQIANLANRSREMDQETRVTVFQFNEKVECLVYDKDVLRLPSLRNVYGPCASNTALIDATIKSVQELQETPERYGDHAFLCYVLTDGQENASRTRMAELQKLFKDLPDNWTLAVLVPDQNGVFEAKRFGFPADNIAVWSATSVKGCEDMGRVITRATETFMQARTKGLRGTRSLFALDTSNLTPRAVQTNLEQLGSDEYDLFQVQRVEEIKPFVERKTGEAYAKGCAFYQLSKAETIQAYKELAVQDHRGRIYVGDNARKLLGLPSVEMRVLPESYGDYTIFVQSTSVNRKLVPGTEVLVRYDV